MISPLSAADTREKYLTVVLDGQACGLPVSRVREIINLQKITPLANQPAFVKGVIPLRGQAVPIIDLRVKLGFPAELAPGACIIVVQAARPDATTLLTGLIVDRVEEVIALEPGEVAAMSSPRATTDVAYLLGLTHAHGRSLLLLDVDRVLPPEVAASL